MYRRHYLNSSSLFIFSPLILIFASVDYHHFQQGISFYSSKEEEYPLGFRPNFAGDKASHDDRGLLGSVINFPVH